MQHILHVASQLVVVCSVHHTCDLCALCRQPSADSLQEAANAAACPGVLVGSSSGWGQGSGAGVMGQQGGTLCCWRLVHSLLLLDHSARAVQYGLCYQLVGTLLLRAKAFCNLPFLLASLFVAGLQEWRGDSLQI